MASLGEYLAEQRDVLVARLVDAASGRDRALGSIEGVSRFLDELVTTLNGAAPPGLLQAEAGCEEGSIADDAVEAASTLGALHGLLLRDAAEHHVEVTLSEHVLLAARVSGAIDGLAGKARPLARHELDHLLHQVRNPLGSAQMAVTLLRAKVDLGDGARLAEMLERNLKRVEELLGTVVDAGSASGAVQASTVCEELGPPAR